MRTPPPGAGGTEETLCRMEEILRNIRRANHLGEIVQPKVREPTEPDQRPKLKVETSYLSRHKASAEVRRASEHGFRLQMLLLCGSHDARTISHRLGPRNNSRPRSGCEDARPMSNAAEAEVRHALGEGFPTHPLHKIVCIGAFVASRQPEGWRVECSRWPARMKGDRRQPGGGNGPVRTDRRSRPVLRKRRPQHLRSGWSTIVPGAGLLTKEQPEWNFEGQIREFVANRKTDKSFTYVRRWEL